MFKVYFKITEAKQTDKRALTVGLAKVGHAIPKVDMVQSFKTDEDHKYYAITVSEVPDHDDVETMTRMLSKFGSVELVSTTSMLDNLYEMAKRREAGTKIKLWFDRATYC